MNQRTEPDIDDNDRTPAGTGPLRPPRTSHLSARAAAAALGVNERTVRRWIEQGDLAATKARGTFRISPAEVERARHDLLADEPVTDVIDVEGGRLRTPPDRPGRPDTSGRAAAGMPAVSSAATAQLEAIRDQWLAPLVDRIEGLAREAAAERARADDAEAERDELRRRIADLETERRRGDAAVSRQDGPGAAEAEKPTEEPRSGFRAWWHCLWRGS